MSQCDYLVPRLFGPGVPVGEGESGGCLLKDGHPGEHLVRTSEGYYLWIPEENFCTDDGKVCDCDFIECYVYWHISDEDADSILVTHGAGTD